jgi:hypothetical protein
MTARRPLGHGPNSAAPPKAAIEMAREIWPELEGFAPSPGGWTFRVGAGYAWMTYSGHVSADPEGTRSHARRRLMGGPSHIIHHQEDDMPGNRWCPPDPRQLPEIRSDLLHHCLSEAALVTAASAINAGRCTLVPVVPGLALSPGSVGATLLARSEHDRLNRAALYYATADMTALAVAAAQTPPTEPVSLTRPPSPAGFMVFADPIGGYSEDACAALAQIPGFRPGPAPVTVTTPIVAVSWSVWTPDAVQLDGGGHVEWMWKGQGGAGIIPRGWRGLWLTFYSPRGLGVGLPPDTELGTMPDGVVMRAHHVNGSRLTGGPLLGWDNEMLLEGAPFGPPPPDTTQTWAQVLYTAWQLIGQQGRTRWAQVEEIPRARSGVKRDTRQGIADSGAVRVMHVHQEHRPPRQAADDDAAASTGRREPSWSCRWPVRPHRRSHCMAPHQHAAGDCQHEDRIIPGHVKGPPDKPLRVGETVHLWDSQPDNDTEEATP